MAAPDKKLRKDGLLSALGGIDSGRSPSLIAPDQIAFGINVTARGGFLTNRPGYDQRPLSFDNDEQKTWFQENPKQGGGTFYIKGGRAVSVVSMGGRIFAIDPLAHFMVTEITPTKSTATAAGFIVPAVGATVDVDMADASSIFIGYPLTIDGANYLVIAVSGNTVTLENVDDTPAAVIAAPAAVNFLDPNRTDEPIAWMEQADKWWIIQNGSDAAIIYDGATSRRSDVTKEVPTGTAMVFNQEIQRLCVATVDNLIEIGDIATGPTSAISFTERTYMAEGGAFRIPYRFGKITGLIMIVNIDRQNGQGPMLAFAERGITSFNLPPNRNIWKDLNYPVQINMPIRLSATGQYGIVEVNGDLFYIAKNGLHSFGYALREFGKWGNRSQSREMNRVLEANTERLLQYGSAIVFDNRLLWTVNPLPSSNGVYHRSLGVLDFDLTSSLRGGDGSAAYDGSWTGMKVTHLMTGEFGGEERAFALVLDGDGHNELWEISKAKDFDNGSVRIESSLETRSMIFGNPLELVRIHVCEAWLADVRGTVDFDLKWKPDQHPCWFDWSTRQVCSKNIDCDNDPLVCKTVKEFKPGYRTRIGFGTPPDASDPGDRKAARVGYEHQIRLAWTGKAEIRKLLLKAQEVDELEYGDNAVAVPAVITNGSTRPGVPPCSPPICVPDDVDGGLPNTVYS